MFHRENMPFKLFITAVFVWFTCLPLCFAQNIDTTSRAVRKEISRAMDVEKNIQERKAAWNEESATLSDRFLRLETEKKQLKTKLEKLELLQRIEEKKYIENKRKQVEANRVRNHLSAYLDSVLIKLETHVNQDLPFLSAERQARINSLKEMMVDLTESSAEKFRRIFEALQIETEYGSTVEATRQTITLEGQSVLADVLRLGRISLFCQTLDKKKTGVFDKAKKGWVLLPKKVNSDMTKALSMARLERSIELVKLPLGRIVKQ